MDRHAAAVEAIRSRVAHFSERKTAFRVYHGSTNSTRHAHFDRDAVVDVSSLNNIISIDRADKTAIVEPNVPMDALVRETLKAGLLPPVVMEFPGITVGGGFVGTAGESSSFKCGFFDRTVLSAEVVLANGDVVQASDTSNQELFEGLRGSFGTLGVLTLVKMRLIDAKKYVEVTYTPTHSIEQTMTTLHNETKVSDSHDYIDGILFSKTSGVVVAGRLTDKTPSSILPLRRFSKPWNEWFWIHAKTLSAKSIETTELVPLEDYLFRYDRGAFWMGMYAFQHFMVPFMWLTRFLLDYFMHTRIMYHALHASGHTDRYIIQDVAFPAQNAKHFANYVDERFNIYPLWLCPVRSDGRSSMGHAKPLPSGIPGDNQHAPGDQCDYINMGVWGPYPSSEPDYVRANRELESKVQQLGGLKWLYSRVFYTEEEWWRIYDKDAYDALRVQFHATSLPSIWEKVRDRGRKEVGATGVRGVLKRVIRSSGVLSGVYGVYKALRGGDYILGNGKRKDE